jgi:murein DD-endopeptidase MepM/ murein hydrolase activator NlpD
MRILVLHRLKFLLLLLCSFTLLGTATLDAATQYQIHKVKRGDNLYNLAKQYGVTVQEIKDLNGLTGNRVDTGQKLKIKPLGETPKTKSETKSQAQPKDQPQTAEDASSLSDNEYTIHHVKRRDNLYNIAKQYGVTVQDIKELNSLKSTQLVVGQELKIKPLKAAAQSKPETKIQTKPADRDQDSDSAPKLSEDKYIIHKVKRGDNLSSIAKQYGVTVKAIKKLNDLSSNRVNAGQRLKIKEQVETPQVAAQPTKKPAAKPVVKPVAKADTTALKPGKTPAAAQVPGSGLTPNRDKTAPSSANLPEDYYHVVQPKDNLFRIAKNNGLTLEQIRKINDFPEDFTAIVPNQRILIKDPSDLMAAATSAIPAADGETPSATETILTATPPSDSVLIEKVYIVQRKDNLFRIAKNNNMTVEELKRINHLTGNAIKVGQKLYIIAPKGKTDDASFPPPVTEEDLKGKSKIRTDLIMPVAGKILSEYGIRNGRPHKGIDLGAPTGMPVYAVLDGTVVYSGVQGSYGNVVVIEHPDFVMTVYAHNEKNLVSVGDVVRQGQTIAAVGSTGNATGPHVHFEYRIKGKAINPRKVLPL